MFHQTEPSTMKGNIAFYKTGTDWLTAPKVAFWKDHDLLIDYEHETCTDVRLRPRVVIRLPDMGPVFETELCATRMGDPAQSECGFS